MVKLNIVNPQATTIIESVKAAPRVDGLQGKTVGLYWNMKSGGDVALERTATLLAERFSDTEFKNVVGSVGAMLRHATAEDADQVARECDVVIGTSSD